MDEIEKRMKQVMPKKTLRLRKKSSQHPKNRKIIPLPIKDEDLDVEFERFLRESKEIKSRYVMKSQSSAIFPQKKSREEKWMKDTSPNSNNCPKKNNSVTTDYNGEIIPVHKLENKNYIPHYIDTDVQMIEDQETRKRSKQVNEKNKIVFINHFRKVKEE
jgi:hypothetical protein